MANNSELGTKFKDKLEDTILLVALRQFDDMKKVGVHYTITGQDRLNIFRQFGRFGRLADDLIDEGIVAPDSLRRLIQHDQANSDIPFLLHERYSSLKNNLRLSFSNYAAFTEASIACANYSSAPQSATAQELIKTSETKGGNFSLALFYCLDPQNVSKEIASAVYYAGAAIQFVDELADEPQDRRLGIRTAITLSTNPVTESNRLVDQCCTKIESELGTREVLIPMIRFLQKTAALTQQPLIRKIFQAINT